MQKLFIISLLIVLTLGISSYVVATETSAPQAEKAANYLLSLREPSGSIGGVGFSSWALQALSANGLSSNQTVAYLEDNLGDMANAPATDLERTILAVIAGGRDPKNFGNTDLVATLKSKTQDNQIGSPELLNDDIFGILALIAANESITDPVVSNSLNYLVSHQQPNGSFSWSSEGNGDSNNTAVAIQALELALHRGWTDTYDREGARDYLISLQKDSGGFPFVASSMADGSSTAWVISAIRSLGEDPYSWVRNGANPIDYLTTLQNESGGVSWGPGNEPDSFTSSFAAIAFAGKALPVAVIVTTSPNPSSTPSAEPTPTPAPSQFPTEEPTASPSPTVTATQPPTPSPTPTIKTSPTPTVISTSTPTPATSPSPAPSLNPSVTPTPAPTVVAFVTVTPSPQPSERTVLNQIVSTVRDIAQPTAVEVSLATALPATEKPSQADDHKMANSDPTVLGQNKEVEPSNGWQIASAMIVAGLGLVGWGTASRFS